MFISYKSTIVVACTELKSCLQILRQGALSPSPQKWDEAESQVGLSVPEWGQTYMWSALDLPGHPSLPKAPHTPYLTALSLHSGAENLAYISEGRVLSSWVERRHSKVRSAGCLVGEAHCRPHVNVSPISCWKSCLDFSREDFQLLSRETFMHDLRHASQLSVFFKRKHALIPFQGIHGLICSMKIG